MTDSLLCRSGFVAIVGRPNVGKSTLLNSLVGQKLSITSRRAQTTRHRLVGILTTGAHQFVFVDTPGYQGAHKNALNRAMNRGVTQALADVDVVLFVLEAGHFGAKDKAVADLLPADQPTVVIVNKIDRFGSREALLPFVDRVSHARNWTAIIPVSAQRAQNLDLALQEIGGHLPRSGLIFPEDELTDRGERFFASEFIREKIFRLLGEELPYSIAVEIERFETAGRLRKIHAAVVVDRPGHKAIVIGQGGQTIKRIASEARQDMERLFDAPVFLEVWVKVKSGWADNERLLRSLGYE